MSSNIVESFISALEPGNTVDINGFEELHGTALKRQLLDELEGLGFVLDSRGTLGEVSICTKCSGDGGDTKACQLCDDFGVTVDYGRGVKPFRE